MSTNPTRSRNWILTVAVDKMDREEICDALKDYRYSGQMEEAASGFLHWQIMVQSDNAIRFDALKKKMPTAHIEAMKGSTQQLYDYCNKESTRIEGTSLSNGVMTLSNRGATRKTLEDFRSEVRAGARVSDVIRSNALTGAQINALREYSNALTEEKYGNCTRDIEVFYLHGTSGTGKTSMIYETYEPRDIYRVTNYKHPFDAYEGQDVLVLDEFYESISFGYLLDVLDRWPLQLQARYGDKWAAFTTVWIISNRQLKDQYKYKRETAPEEYAPWLRRITHAYTLTADEFKCDDSLIHHYFPDRATK